MKRPIDEWILRFLIRYLPGIWLGQTFQPYDFGPYENQLLYGQPSPPAYDLSKVTCPVFIFWGEDDKVP